MRRSGTSRLRSTVLVLALTGAALLAAPSVQAQQSRAKGYVDKSGFVELAGGDDAVQVEVSIHKSLIKIFCASLEEDLKEIACALDSIEAVVLKVPGGDRQDRASKVIGDTEKTLLRRGWERIALVREEDEEVHVLILNTETEIGGLVVMVMDRDEGQLIFVNIAGTIDLEAMQRLAGQLHIPGLEGIDLGEKE